MGVFDSIMGVAGGLIGGVASLGSSWMNWQSQRETNQQEMDLANTAVQRRAADMQAAGINPLLAAGNPASTPQLSAPRMENPGPAILGGARDAVNIAQTQSQVRLTNAQADKAQTEAEIADRLKEYTVNAGTVASDRADLELKLRQLNDYQPAVFNKALAEFKLEHFSEFADLQLQAAQQGVTGQELANQERDLAIKLAQKDLEWYDTNAKSSNYQRYVGSTAAAVGSGTRAVSTFGGKRTSAGVQSAADADLYQ